jgi:hypothetical protein
MKLIYMASTIVLLPPEDAVELTTIIEDSGKQIKHFNEVPYLVIEEI